MKLLIGTPAYGGMVHLDYLNSMLEYQRQGLDFALASIGNESLITRARNSVISYFYAHKDDFTHLLFLDADVRLTAKDLKLLMSFGKDVIGAPVPLKSYGPDGNPKYNFSGFDENVADHLYLTQKIGTAVMLLSRAAIVDLVEEARNAGRVYRNWSGYDNSQILNDIEMVDVFQVGVVDGQYLSEDYWVCRRLQELGYGIHVTDAVVITHHGMHGFRPQLRKT